MGKNVAASNYHRSWNETLLPSKKDGSGALNIFYCFYCAIIVNQTNTLWLTFRNERLFDLFFFCQRLPTIFALYVIAHVLDSPPATLSTSNVLLFSSMNETRVQFRHICIVVLSSVEIGSNRLDNNICPSFQNNLNRKRIHNEWEYNVQRHDLTIIPWSLSTRSVSFFHTCFAFR